MKSVNFYENSEYLKIQISVRDSQKWILPMLIFVFLGFSCGLTLIYIVFLAFLKNIDTSVMFIVLGVFLVVSCGYGVTYWLFNTFGKEILIFDNKRGIFSYKMALFKIRVTKRFYYRDMSTFIASDSLLPYQFLRRTDIWTQCEFNYKGKKLRFGYLKSLADAINVVEKINKYISMESQIQDHNKNLIE
ncbi:MAG TPA: hypothetical protein VIO64_02610 [Pseudobacteroides sp.]|uniref:hypothetical protein n=1 Tax=Pseudobacteroides sp. TaxID=1968840 RepID=UPI002F93CFA0